MTDTLQVVALKDPIQCLSGRARSCLRSVGIRETFQLLNVNEDDLRRIPNCGPKTTDEIMLLANNLSDHWRTKLPYAGDVPREYGPGDVFFSDWANARYTGISEDDEASRLKEYRLCVAGKMALTGSLANEIGVALGVSTREAFSLIEETSKGKRPRYD